MADPLAIASGIAGLLSLGIQVTQALVNFYATHKDKDTDLAKITHNLESLQRIFRALDVAVKERGTQANTQDLLREAGNAVQNCEETITELQSECEKFHRDSAAGFKDRVKVAGRRAAYPFRKSTLQKLEEDVADIRANISFALDVLQLRSHTQIEDRTSEIKSLVERINASQISLIIRCWLMAPDASIDHHTTCEKCHLGTGLWFIKDHHFRTWLDERNSFLWLNGFAGCGKSVLCSTAIQHTFRETRHKNGVGIAFFYFTFANEAKQDVNGMLRTLLLQLSAQLQDGERLLERLHALHKSGSPPVYALLDYLRFFLERFRDTYILLDALDECPRDCEREDVLKTIQVMRDWSISSLHLLVTSRSVQDIRESLRPSLNQDLPLRNSEIDRDIANYITYQLENDKILQKWKDRHHEIETKLTAGAQGVFRYVECQFKALRRAKNRNQLDKCLRALPRDLDETYERILSSIDGDYIEDVRRVLTVLCYSRRPVTVDELIDAHAVDLSEPSRLDRDGRSYEQEDLVDICLGLIEFAAAEDDNGQTILTVRIAHFSVQEYLQSDRILQQNSRVFAMRSATANAEMTLICLAYLIEPALSVELLDETKLTMFPFADYAAKYWFDHYASSGEGKKTIEPPVRNLFKDEMAFVTWIRLHDMDRPWKKKVDYDRPITDMASPSYYAALLGSEFLLNSILPIDTGDPRVSEIVNAQGGEYGNALQAASRGGHMTAVQMLLDRGAEIDAQGGEYGNALQAAAYQGHTNVVQMLLDRGADINAQGGEYGNALRAAAYQGHMDAVQMLLDRGANINVLSGWLGNALQAAAYQGHKDVVQILLDRGADINAQGGDCGNALQAASYGGYENVMRILLDQNADVNAQGGEYGNALQAAAYKGHKNVVQMLLDRGANINAQGGDYGNALQAASRGGHMTVVQMLLDRGAEINAQGGEYGNALQAAAYQGHINVVQILLNRGADMNVQIGWLGNALQAAIYRGYKDIVQMLLDRGADVNAQGGHFGNALQAASRGGYMNIVQMLLDRAADINAQGGKYGNALQAAVYRGYEKVVQMLVDRGAALHVRDPLYGHTPLSLAVKQGHDAIVKLFLHTNKDLVHERDDCGRTALFCAAQYGRDTVAKTILMDNSINPDHRDYYGSTPLSIAARHAHVDVVRALLATGIVTSDSHDRFGRSVFWWAKRSGNAHIEKMLTDYSKKRGISTKDAEHVDGRLAPRGCTSAFCDVCTLNFVRGDTYYRYGVCSRGKFAICVECYELEGRCLQDGHGLTRMKDNMVFD